MNKILLITSIALVLLFVITIQEINANIFEKVDLIANVTKIIDGDTIQLDNGDRIRLAIANTPERGEDGYKQASSFTAKTCLNKIALVDYDSKQSKGDRYGRDVAAVVCIDMHFINKELLDQGHAKIYDYYCKPNKSEFREVLC